MKFFFLLPLKWHGQRPRYPVPETYKHVRKKVAGI